MKIIWIIFLMSLTTQYQIKAIEHYHPLFFSTTVPPSFHPLNAGSGGISNYINQIFDTLTVIDSSGSLRPGLATSWKFLNNTSLLLNLRKGVKFHNGEEFNADAAKFIFELFLNPIEIVDNKSYWGDIKNVKKIDTFTIVIELKHPDSLLPYRLATVGHALPPKYYSQVGREKFSKMPIGTGPFKFVGMTPKNTLKMLRNDQYWGGSPDIEGVEFYFLPTIDNAIDLLKKGKLDFVGPIPGRFTPEIIKVGTIQIIKELNFETALLMINTKKDGIFRKTENREALRIGLNLNDILKFGYRGNGKLTTTLTLESELFHSLNFKQKQPTNIIKAREIISKNNIRKGTPVTLLVVEQLDLVGQMLLKQLESLGFKVNVLHATYDDEKKAIALKNRENKIPNIDLAIVVCSHRFANGAFPMLILMHSKGDWSLTCDKQLDGILNKAVSEIKSTKQIQLFRQASEYITDYNLIIPIFQTAGIYGVKKGLTFIPHKTGYIYLKDIKKIKNNRKKSVK